VGRAGAAALALTAGVLLVGACSSDGRPDAADRPRSTTTAPELVPPDELGPFEVGHTTTAAIDPDRDRVLPLTVWYPSDEADGAPARYPYVDGIEVVSEHAVDGAPVADGRFPLVIFSHGFGGTPTQSAFLVEALASHGFVVVAPAHLGNTAFDVAAGTDVEQSVSAADRLPDVSLVIDDAVKRNDDPEDPFRDHLDTEHIGVTGHSFGGFTTLAVAAETDGEPFDPRVDAIAAIAPGSPLSDEALASIEIPTLLVGGTLDTTTPIDPNVTRPWELIGSDDLYRVDVIDAGHLSFANPCDQRDAAAGREISPYTSVVLAVSAEDSCGPERVDVAQAHRLTNRYVVAFFEVHLAGDAAYEEYLTPTSGVEFAP
jgi:predicted dienelactone hydrolase